MEPKYRDSNLDPQYYIVIELIYKKFKKIATTTYKHQPTPRPQQGRRRSLTGLPSATA